jgi:hypothetical protein
MSRRSHVRSRSGERDHGLPRTLAGLVAWAALQDRRIWLRVVITLITIEMAALMLADEVPAALVRIFR